MPVCNSVNSLVHHPPLLLRLTVPVFPLYLVRLRLQVFDFLFTALFSSFDFTVGVEDSPLPSSGAASVETILGPTF